MGTPVVHAFAGACGGMASITLLYPLDSLRTRLQIEDDRKAEGIIAMLRQIIGEEGWRSLYTGLRSMLLTMGVSNFVYFLTYERSSPALPTRSRSCTSATSRRPHSADTVPVTSVQSPTLTPVAHTRARVD